MVHRMRLRAQPYEQIAAGTKIFELRLYDEKRRAIRVGDTVAFVNAEDDSRCLFCEVVALHLFPSFRVLYRSLPLLACGYTEQTLPTASYTDMEVYYSKEEQEKYSVVGIELRLLVAEVPFFKR